LGAVYAFLADGDFATTEQFLDIAVANASDAAARSYAIYHLLRGGIGQKINQFRRRVEATPSANDARVLTHLYRANGDLRGARWAAQRANDPELFDAILFESGDWKSLAARSRLTPDDAGDLEKLGQLATYQRLAGDQDGFDQSLASLRRLAAGLRGTKLPAGHLGIGEQHLADEPI
jgi:hypothetical protein